MLGAVRCNGVAESRGSHTAGLSHPAFDGHGDGVAESRGARLEERVLDGHAAPTARPASDCQTRPAATAVLRVLEPSSPMLSELRRLRDALREHVNHSKAFLAGRDAAPSTLSDASGVRGDRSAGDARLVAASIAALWVARPASRALSRLQERRDALRELVDEAKAAPPSRARDVG